jgi:hypothetical protein
VSHRLIDGSVDASISDPHRRLVRSGAPFMGSGGRSSETAQTKPLSCIIVWLGRPDGCSSSAANVRMDHRLPKLDAQTLITDRLGADLPFAEGAELHDHAARVVRGGAAPA